MTARPDTVEAGGLRLPLIHTADGPRIEPDGELSGLAEFVNGFLNGVFEGDVRALVRAGEGVGRGGVYARSLPDGLDPIEEGAPWHRLTGSELGDDAVMAGSSVTGAFVLPRSALLEILDRMLDVRAQAAEHADGAAPAAAAMAKASEPPSESIADEAQDVLARAVATRPGAPGRADELDRLEARAGELAAMEDSAEAAARRRTLLIELDVMGLLSGAETAARELAELRLPALAGYHAAARRLLEYLANDERRELVRGAVPGPVLGAPVSLDWFRQGPEVPDGYSVDGWTALGEALLTAATPSPTPEGEFFSQWAGRWYRVRWRRDDGNTPALLELEPL